MDKRTQDILSKFRAGKLGIAETSLALTMEGYDSNQVVNLMRDCTPIAQKQSVLKIK